MRAAVDAVLRFGSFIDPDAESTDGKGLRVTPRQRVFDQVRAIRSWRGAARLGRLDVPTTVVHGSRDPLIPVGNGMRLSRLIPGAEYVELAGVGHLVPHEAGAALLGLLRPVAV